MSDNPKLKAWTIMLVTALAFLFVYLYEDNRQSELDRQFEAEQRELDRQHDAEEREKNRQIQLEKIKRERELREP